MTEDEFFNQQPPNDFFEPEPEPEPNPVPVMPVAPVPTPDFQAQAAALNLSKEETETARRVIETLGIRQDDGLIPLVLLQSRAISAYASVPAAVASATATATESAIAAVQKVAAAESAGAAQKTASEIKRLIRAGAPSSIYMMWSTWAPLSLFVAGLLFGYFWGNAREYQSAWVSSILKTFIVFQ